MPEGVLAQPDTNKDSKAVHHVRFLDDGLYGVNELGTLMKWDADRHRVHWSVEVAQENQSRTQIQTLRQRQDPPQSLPVPFERAVAACFRSPGDQRLLTLVRNQVLDRQPQAHAGGRAGLCVLVKRGCIATVGGDRFVRFWSLKGAKIRRAEKKALEHSRPLISVAVDADENLIAAVDSTGGMSVWDGASGEVVYFTHLGGAPGEPLTGRIAFNRSGDRLAAFGTNQGCHVFTYDAVARTFERIPEQPPITGLGGTAMVWSPAEPHTLIAAHSQPGWVVASLEGWQDKRGRFHFTFRARRFSGDLSETMHAVWDGQPPLSRYVVEHKPAPLPDGTPAIVVYGHLKRWTQNGWDPDPLIRDIPFAEFRVSPLGRPKRRHRAVARHGESGRLGICRTTDSVEFVGVGDYLPETPWFLRPGFYVPAPLDETDQAAWAMPPPLREERL